MKPGEIWNKILDFFGFDEEMEDSISGTNEKFLARKKDNKVVSLDKKKKYKLIFYEPDSYNEVKTIADDLGNKQPVIINIEELDKAQARRILDFVSGAVYALGGNVKKVGQDVFLFTPYDIQIDGEEICDKTDERVITRS